MARDRELKFVLKVKDDGSAALRKVSQEFDSLAQAEELAQSASRELGRSFDFLERQVDTLTGGFKSLDRVMQGSKISLSDFKKGVRTGLKESIEDMSDWARAGERLAVSMTHNMASAFDDTLFAVLKGDFDEVGQVWQHTLDSMLRAFTGFVAQVAAAWTISTLTTSLGWPSVMIPGLGAPGSEGMGLWGTALGGYGAYSLLAGHGATAAGGLAPGMLAFEASAGAGMLASANVGLATAEGGLLSSVGAIAPYALAALAAQQLLKHTGLGTQIFSGVSDLVGNIPIIGGFVGDIVSGIGSFLGFQRGVSYVPETTPAIIHKGERVLSAEHNERLIRAVESGGGGIVIQGPLINVEGALIANEAALERFAEEIDIRLKTLAERRF